MIPLNRLILVDILPAFAKGNDINGLGRIWIGGIGVKEKPSTWEGINKVKLKLFCSNNNFSNIPMIKSIWQITIKLLSHVFRYI